MEKDIFGNVVGNITPVKDKVSLSKMMSSDKAPTYDIAKLVPDMPYDKRYEDFKILPTITPDTMSDVFEMHAQNQGFWDLSKGVVVQSAIGEFVGGIIEGVGSMPKIIDRANGVAEAFDKSWLEELGGDIRKSASDFAPIYQTREAQKGLAFGDASYWASMAPSFISSISILVPALGVSALARMGITGIRALKAANELGQISKVVDEVGDVGKALSATAKLAKGAVVEGELAGSLWTAAKQAGIDARRAGSWEYKVSDIVVPALVSRSIDSGRESVGRYEQYYNDYKEQFKNDVDGGEARAKKIASEAAAEGYRESYSNILFDLVEWTLLGGLKTNPVNKLANLVDDHTFGKILKDKLGMGVATELGVKANTKGFGEWAARVAKSKTTQAVSGSFLAEGFDETMMDFFMENGKYNAEVKNNIRRDDGETITDRIIKHHQVAKNWDSFVGGALGGTLMVGGKAAIDNINSKYFDKAGKEYVANIANAYITDRKNVEDLAKKYFIARDSKTPMGEATATTLKAQLISTIVGKAHATGTLGLHIKAFENMGMLNDEDKAQLDFYKNDTGEVIPSSELYTKEILDSLKTAEKIYDLEFSKRHFIDNAINNRFAHEIAFHKSVVSVLDSDVKQLEKANELVDNTKTIELRTNELNTLASQNSIDEVTTQGLHDTIAQHNKTLSELQHSIDSLDGHSAITKTFIDAMEQDKLRIETELANESITPTKKALLKRELNNVNSHIIDLRSTVYSTNKKIELAKTKVEETNAKLKEDIKSIKENNSISDEYVKQVQDIHDVYDKNINDNKSNTNSIAALKGSIKTRNETIEKLQSEEGKKEFSKKTLAEIELSKQKVVTEFQENVDAMTDEKDISAHLVKVSSENKLTPEVITKLSSIVKERLSKLEQDKIDTKNINKESTSKPGAIPVTEEQVKKNPLLASINRRRNDSINSIKRASAFEQITSALRGKKYKSYSYTYETSDGRIIEVSNLRNDDSQENNPNSKLTTEQELEALHNGVYDNTKVGEVKFKTDKEAKEHIERVYAQELSSRTTESLVASSPTSGQETAQNGTETQVVETLVPEVVETPVFVDGQFQNNVLDNHLTRSIQQHSNEVILDEDTHTYTYVHDVTTQTNNGSASSMLLSKPFVGRPSSGLNEATVGLNVDKMIRDFFKGELQEASNYNMSDEAYAELHNYIKLIGEQIKKAGFTVLANDITLFDSETEVAGQIDLLLVNNRGEVYIYDIKTSKGFKGWTNKYKFQYDESDSTKVVNPSKLDKYLAQLNVYAVLFEKIHGIKVTGLGLMIFDVEFNNNTITTVTPNTTNITDSINSTYNADLHESQDRLLSKNGIPNTDIVDNSIIGFPVNYNFLNRLSNIKNTNDEYVSIAQALHLEKLNTLIEQYSTAQISQFVAEVLEEKDGIIQLPSDEKLPIYNLINSLFEFDEVTKMFVLRQTTENIDYFLQNQAQIDYAAGDTNVTIQSILDFILDNTNIENIENLRTVIGIGLENYESLYNLKQAIDTRETSDLSGGYSISQIQKANTILSNIKTLSQLHIESETEYFRIPIFRTELFTNLIALQKALTNSDSIHLSVEGVILLLQKAVDIADKNVEISELISIAESLITSMEYFKKDIISERAKIISKRLAELNDKYENDNITFDEETNSFKKNSGETIEDTMANGMFQYYDNLYKNIYYNIKTTVFKDTRITETEVYSRERIAKIIEKYNNSKTVSINGLGMTINPIMNEEETSIDTKASISKSIMDMRVGDLINISIKEDGSLEFHTMDNDTAIGVMANISTHINGLRIAKEGSDKYIGFSKILPIIEKLLTNNESSIVGSLELLRNIKIQQVIASANNVTEHAKQNAISKIESLINNILKFKENTSENNIKTIVEHFIKENASIDDNYDVTKEDIENVINVLFFNSHPELLNDKTVLNAGYIIHNVKSFDTVNSLNHLKYKRFAKKLNNKLQVVKGKVNNINKASLLTHNRGINDRIQDVVKPIDMEDGTTPEIKLITNKTLSDKTIILDGKTKKPLSGKLKGISPVRTISVVIENTNGEISTIPFNQRTISEITGYDANIGIESNMGNIYTQHISNAINDIISSVQKLLVGGERVEIRERIIDEVNTIFKNSKLADLIVTGGKYDNIIDSPYFANYYVVEKNKYVIKFKTVSRNAKLGNVTINHNIVFNANELHYSQIDTSHQLDLKDRVLASDSIEVSSKESQYDNHVRVRFNDGNNLDKFNDMLIDESKGIGGLLRQAHVTKDGLTFVDGDTFTDPITGKTYTNAQDYLFETNGGYAQIDVQKDSLGNKITNVDLANRMVFDIDLEGATTIQNGTITDPMEDINIDNPIIGEVADIVEEVNTQLNVLFKDRLITTHEGAPNKNIDDKAIIEISSSVEDNKMTFGMTYFDRFAKTLLHSTYYSNPVVNILHENIHKVLMSITNLSNLETTEKAKLIKYVNDNALSIIESFEKQYELVKDDNDWVNKFKPYTEVNQNPSAMIERMITLIKEDIAKCNTNLDKGLTDSNAIAQELFTYMTNPMLMLAFSTVSEVASDKYNAKTEKSFIAKLIDKLINIYNKILETFGISDKLDTNYTTQIKDLLNDAYNGFTKGINELNINIPNASIETNVVETVATEVNNKRGRNYVSREVQSLSLDNSEIISIFAESNIINIETNPKDDSNYVIC